MTGLVEVVVVEGVVYLVGQVGVLEVVVLKHGKKRTIEIQILMISLGLFFPSSLLVLESLGAAVS